MNYPEVSRLSSCSGEMVWPGFGPGCSQSISGSQCCRTAVQSWPRTSSGQAQRRPRTGSELRDDTWMADLVPTMGKHRVHPGLQLDCFSARHPAGPGCAVVP